MRNHARTRGSVVLAVWQVFLACPDGANNVSPVECLAYVVQPQKKMRCLMRQCYMNILEIYVNWVRDCPWCGWLLTVCYSSSSAAVLICTHTLSPTRTCRVSSALRVTRARMVCCWQSSVKRQVAGWLSGCTPVITPCIWF